MTVELRLNHLAVREANAAASHAWRVMDKARIAHVEAQKEYEATWTEAYEFAKKADRNKDGYGIVPQ
jgi:hypothetical protein